MTQLFHRSVALLVADTVFADDAPLHVTFEVSKTAQREPNTASLEIYNLGSDLRARISERGAPIALEAGYQDELSQLFSGRIVHAEHSRSGADMVTSVECEDDGGATAKRINASFGPGTRLSDIIEAAVAALGVGRGNLDEAIGASSYRKSLIDLPRGLVLHGRAVDELDRVLRTAGLRWSIQDGQLQVLKPEATTTTEAVLLSSSSGLIGEVAAAERGVVKIRSLLRGALVPNDRVQVESNSVSGLYRLACVSHTGDTHGQDWYTDMEAEAA